MVAEHSIRVGPSTLRLLTYNIQLGFATRSYREFVTGSWRHAFAHREIRANMQRIGAALMDFDIVALQEADAGSRRTTGLNLVTELAAAGGFEHWHCLVNRNLGRFAQHAQGVLSRVAPMKVESHRLPGRITGRNVLLARVGGREGLLVVCTHLALAARARKIQLDYIAELIGRERFVVLMGDTNCELGELQRSGLRHTSLQLDIETPLTYPSWQPRRSLDHILVSEALRVDRRWAPVMAWSDHRPVAVDVILPRQLQHILHAP